MICCVIRPSMLYFKIFMKRKLNHMQTPATTEKTAHSTFWTRTPVIVLAAFVCCFLWGSAFPCIKVGYRLFDISSSDTAEQILFAGMRFALAGVLVLLFADIRQHKFLRPKRKAWKHVLILSFLQTAGQYFFFYIGLAHTSGVKSSIITGSGTFLSVLVAALIFRMEKLNARKILGCAVGFAGVILIQLPGASLNMSFHFSGEGFVLISAFLSALSASYIKIASRDENPVILSGWQFFVGGIAMAAAGLAAGGRLHPQSRACVPLLLYMAFISAMAYTLWSVLLKYNEVSRITIFGFMNPVIGVLLSALILHEQNQAFSAFGVGAAVLVSAGIILVNSKGEKSP